MIEYKEFELDFKQAFNTKYEDLMTAIYDAIPAHDIDDMCKEDTVKLLGYYPKLYTTLSRHFSMLLMVVQPRVYDSAYFMREAYEQALKVVKFQYDALSRKITVDKQEGGMWGSETK